MSARRRPECECGQPNPERHPDGCASCRTQDASDRDAEMRWDRPADGGPRILIEHGGVTRTLKEWADELELSRDTIYYRLRRGLSPAEALTPHMRRRAPNWSRPQAKHCRKGHVRTGVKDLGGGHTRLFCEVCENAAQRRRWAKRSAGSAA